VRGGLSIHKAGVSVHLRHRGPLCAAPHQDIGLHRELTRRAGEFDAGQYPDTFPVMLWISTLTTAVFLSVGSGYAAGSPP
jgi:hypothetical protein